MIAIARSRGAAPLRYAARGGCSTIPRVSSAATDSGGGSEPAPASAPAGPPAEAPCADAPSASPVAPGRATLDPRAPIALAVRRSLGDGLSALAAQRRAALAGDVEAIHQMRVAARRLRARIELFRGVIHGSRALSCHNDLRWFGRAAGAVRECDVMADLLRDRAARIDSALADATPPLLAALARERGAAHREFALALDSNRYRRMCTRIADPLLRKIAPEARVADLAPGLIAPILRKAIRAGRRVRAGAEPARIHRLRIRLKRLRYALETLGELGGKRLRRALARLAALQELLGRHQDFVAAIGWLRGCGAEHAQRDLPPPALIAAGSLMHDLARRREKIAARIVRRWRRMAREETLEAALGEIADAARAAAAEAGAAAVAGSEPAVTAGPAPTRNEMAVLPERAATELNAEPASKRAAPIHKSQTTPTDDSA